MEKRKQGRPSLPRNIEEYVIGAAMKNPDMKRLALVDKVEKELKERGFTPPAKDTMLKLFQKAPKPVKQDEKWSLAKSVEYGLPADATGELLEVWSFCMAAGREFTVRHAKWACYLRSIHQKMPEPNRLGISEIYGFSVLYANRERICGALNVVVDTFDLDAQLGLSYEEAATALRVGVLNKNQFGVFPKSLPQAGITKMRDFGDESDTVLADMGFSGPYGVDQSFGLFVPDGLVLPWQIVSNRIYAYWLGYFGKAPKWKQLSKNEQKNIILKLKRSIESVLKHDPPPIEFWKGEWEPTELLKTIGYESNPKPEKDIGLLFWEVRI